MEPITQLGASSGSSGYGKVPPTSQPKPVILSEPVWNVAVKGQIAPTSDLPPPPKNSLTEKVVFSSYFFLLFPLTPPYYLPEPRTREMKLGRIARLWRDIANQG
jgi:hypothetical protein